MTDTKSGGELKCIPPFDWGELIPFDDDGPLPPLGVTGGFQTKITDTDILDTLFVQQPAEHGLDMYPQQQVLVSVKEEHKATHVDSTGSFSSFLNENNEVLPDIGHFKLSYFRNNKGKRQGGRVST
jgi:hypothetical protein